MANGCICVKVRDTERIALAFVNGPGYGLGGDQRFESACQRFGHMANRMEADYWSHGLPVPESDHFVISAFRELQSVFMERLCVELILGQLSNVLHQHCLDSHRKWLPNDELPVASPWQPALAPAPVQPVTSPEIERVTVESWTPVTALWVAEGQQPESQRQPLLSGSPRLAPWPAHMERREGRQPSLDSIIASVVEELGYKNEVEQRRRSNLQAMLDQGRSWENVRKELKRGLQKMQSQYKQRLLKKAK